MAVISSKQIVCRWLLKHQHKLKQTVRACSLQVKEAPQIDELANERYETESEITFKASDLTTKLADPGKLRTKPDVSELKFGHFFTDHMLKINYHETLGGWQKPKIVPFGNLSLHPAARALHYAIELFEGTKVYRGIDGKLRWFRPDLNMIRMNKSAQMVGLPTFSSDELIKCISRLIQIDQEWVPHSERASLYIRPTFIAIDGTLGVAKSESSLLYVIMCPVGSYWAEGQNDSVDLYADPRFARAWPGGCGNSKLGSNYAPTIRVQSDAQKKGLHQVLWLYGPDNYITEVGTMNIFLYYKDSNGGQTETEDLLQNIFDLMQQFRHSNTKECNKKDSSVKGQLDRDLWAASNDHDYALDREHNVISEEFVEINHDVVEENQEIIEHIDLDPPTKDSCTTTKVTPKRKILENVLATPPLNELILPGVTRDSILALGRQWKEFRIEERMVTMRELVNLQKQGRLLEMFGAGTACIITPVSSIEFLGDTITIPTMQQENPIYRKLRSYLSAIQYGHIEHPWGMIID